MSADRVYFTDTVGNSLTYLGDTVDADVDPAEADTVVRDDHWADFFGTDEFVEFEATVAQPIIQPYVYNDELHKFRKTETELKQAQAQIENLPWTMGHPKRDRVTDANQIRGVWTDPRWRDGQIATLHIPANDPEAVRYAVHNDEVSIGFGGRLDWTDDEDSEYDAVQRDMAYDHIASVENGRCPPEEGCGLHTDAAHGHVATELTDGVQTTLTEEGDKTEAREERAEYRYETRDGAVSGAEELNCDKADAEPEAYTHTHEKDNGVTVYEPCASHAEFRRAFTRERGHEFTYDTAHVDDIGEEQTEAIKTIRDEHDEMDSSEISPNLSTLKEVYERGAAAWQQSHAPGASQQQWALARVREFLKDMRNGNALNSGADNDLAPDGYSPPSTDSAHDVYRRYREETDGEHMRMEDLAAHQYDTAQAARSAGDELGCDGVHKHGEGEDAIYMPCSSMEEFDEVVGDEHTDSVTSCGCRPQSPLADEYVGPCSDGPCSCGMHVAGDAEINGETIDLTVPDGAQSAAQAFLDAKEAGVVPDDCGTGVGTESAKMIADGEVTAERLVADIAPYLNSHEEDTSTDTHPTDWSMDAESDTPWQDCGDAQYAAWGWHSLTDWARRKADAIKTARGEEPVYTDGVFGDTTIMDTIEYDGLMGGDLDESAIPNEGYEPHYVFAADTKSDSSFPLVDAEGNLRRGNVDAAFDLRGHADDEGLLVDVLESANDAFAQSANYTAPIDDADLSDAMTDTQTDGSSLSSMIMSAVEDSDMSEVEARSAIAEEADVTPETVDAVMSGESECPAAATLQGVADALGVDAADVMATAEEDGCNYDMDGEDAKHMGEEDDDNMTDDMTDPTDFYDGEPTIDQLADDFSAVALLADEKESLAEEVAQLRDDLRAAKRPIYEDKAAELATMTDRWGDKDDLMDKFDSEDEDERWTVDEIDAKLELVKDIKAESTTTVDSTDEDAGTDEATGMVADNDGTISEAEIDRTQGGRYDLRTVRRS